MIYFIQQGMCGPIKIGKSNDVDARLKDLQVANPIRLRLVGIQNGRDYIETELHDTFKDDRIYGEWFNPTRKVIGYIEELEVDDYVVEIPFVGYDSDDKNAEQTRKLMGKLNELSVTCKQLKIEKGSYRDILPYTVALEKDVKELRDENNCLKRKLQNQ